MVVVCGVRWCAVVVVVVFGSALLESWRVVLVRGYGCVRCCCVFVMQCCGGVVGVWVLVWGGQRKWDD